MVFRRRDKNSPPIIDGTVSKPEAAPATAKPVLTAAEIAAKKRGIVVEDYSDPSKAPTPKTPPAPEKSAPRREVEVIDYTGDLPTPQPNMAKAEKLVEFIHAPNKLKKKVGEGASGFDAGVFLRAQEAVKNLANNYIDGIAPKEMRDLNNAVMAMSHFPDRQHDYILKIFNQGHEIKSGGGSYGYPLISKIAESLCKLTEGMRQAEEMDLALIKFHQDALNIVVRKKIKGIGGEIGQLLVEGLGVIVAKRKAHDPSLVMEHINQFLEKLDA